MNTLKLTDSELEVLFSFYEIGMRTITKDYTESRFDPKTEHHLRQNIHLHMLKDYDVEVNKDVVMPVSYTHLTLPTTPYV